MVIATGVTADGHREVLSCNWGHLPLAGDGDAETLDFWKSFLGSLRDRGLHGVQRVISDQHRGLVWAIEQTMTGASWQRSIVKMAGGGSVPLVYLHRRERTLAA